MLRFVQPGEALDIKSTHISCICVYVTVCVVNSASGSSGDTAEINSRTTNPMVKLFCGQFLSAGINEGMRLPWMLIFLLFNVILACIIASVIVTVGDGSLHYILHRHCRAVLRESFFNLYVVS